jgi:multidrug efflux pump
MVVRTDWPGASRKTRAYRSGAAGHRQIEKKLQETPHLDFLRSYSKPGESLIFILKDDHAAGEVPDDLVPGAQEGRRHPQTAAGRRTQGPFFNDEFGDTFGNIYALVGDGYSYAQLKDYAEKVRLKLLRVPDVAKVDLLGLQDEKIFVEIVQHQAGHAGLDPHQRGAAILQRQNAVTAAGNFETATDRIFLRASGASIRSRPSAETTIRANNRLFRLGDIARVYRGYADPPRPHALTWARRRVGVGVR